MHKMTFFPLGNADCCRINLENERTILVDFAATRDPDDADDRRCDLPELLRADLKARKREFFDVVAFTQSMAEPVVRKFVESRTTSPSLPGPSPLRIRPFTSLYVTMSALRKR